ncbi:MFS transporter [Microbacterium sp. 18062]|uniref:MFS transporter n=1 Tax=Microbacterium sp. 18062 TaxID=2681410 RepID=UPI00135C418C|nr:MFS transporter [Microbacterium sp. 18062]
MDSESRPPAPAEALSAAAAGTPRPSSTRPWPVVAWGFWDWGSAAFNAVATTFVFTVYLTSSSFGDETSTSAALSWALAGAGIVVLVTAPVIGQRSDASAHRKRWLAVNTAVVVGALALMFFVQPDPAYLWFGLGLLAIGTVFFELASVNYNAMLAQVSTSRSVGKVSGFGWGMGYIGGIALLLIVYFGFIQPDVGWFGVTAEDGSAVRVSMLIAALWFALSAIPVFFAVPENAPLVAHRERVGFFGAYGVLFRNIAKLWRESRHTVYFLLSSAVFRDGLTGVFTFGGVLAAGTFGFSPGEVIIFAIAANIVAGVATIGSGSLDDRFGPKLLILVSLVGLIVSGLCVFLFHDGGQTVFWIFGLILCLFVGPAQSASRTFLARLIPPGREGEVFGLYATTGRAAVFLSPTAFGLFVTIGGAQYWGILGLVLVLLVGLALLIPVRSAGRRG